MVKQTSESTNQRISESANQRISESTNQGIVLRYLGDGSQVWSCVPPKDLTRADLERIERVIRGPSLKEILELARFPSGEPLYEELTQEVQHGSDTE